MSCHCRLKAHRCYCPQWHMSSPDPLQLTWKKFKKERQVPKVVLGNTNLARFCFWSQSYCTNSWQPPPLQVYIPHMSHHIPCCQLHTAHTHTSQVHRHLVMIQQDLPGSPKRFSSCCHVWKLFKFCQGHGIMSSLFCLHPCL